jgi:hypothetical protein
MKTTSDDRQPKLGEGQARTGHRGREPDPQRPIAAGREEPELAGALGDLGVGAVLGTRVDTPRHEREERSDDPAQPTGQDQCRHADWLEPLPAVVGPDAVHHGEREEEHRHQLEDTRFSSHGWSFC